MRSANISLKRLFDTIRLCKSTLQTVGLVIRSLQILGFKAGCTFDPRNRKYVLLVPTERTSFIYYFGLKVLSKNHQQEKCETQRHIIVQLYFKFNLGITTMHYLPYLPHRASDIDFLTTSALNCG